MSTLPKSMPIVDIDSELVRALVREYAIATEHYACAVAELNRQRPIASREEYGCLYKVVEDARSVCGRLRLELNKLRP
jgi:hypothetical protein